jgi:hypothetical protein
MSLYVHQVRALLDSRRHAFRARAVRRILCRVAVMSISSEARGRVGPRGVALWLPASAGAPLSSARSPDEH